MIAANGRHSSARIAIRTAKPDPIEPPRRADHADMRMSHIGKTATESQHHKTLHDKYVSTVSGTGADTDRIHCIWTWIQWIHHVLYLTVSGPRPDTFLIQRIHYVSQRIYHVGMSWCKEKNHVLKPPKVVVLVHFAMCSAFSARRKPQS